jgi:endonuclease YncB( thermonuclease family)
VVLTIGILVVLPALAAEPFVGPARVIDGDTIVINGIHVRLQGVAAPEMAHPGQAHDEPGRPEARAFMHERIEGHTVCELTGERTRGRQVGICMVEGRDLGTELIQAGLARDCPRFFVRRGGTTCNVIGCIEAFKETEAEGRLLERARVRKERQTWRPAGSHPCRARRRPRSAGPRRGRQDAHREPLHPSRPNRRLTASPGP